MHRTFAHSEQKGKSDVRYLRGAQPGSVRYNSCMKLRIKELREAREWTVEHLGNLVGLSKSYVSEIENGKKVANQTRIQKFAKAFDVHVIELIAPETLGGEEAELFGVFAKMNPEKRRALIAVAQSMSDK